MQPSFVYPAANMYAGNASLNSEQAFIDSTQGTAAASHVNPNAFIAISQGAAAAPLANYNVVADSAWYIDSGATNHVTQDADIFLSCSRYTGIEKLYIGNGLGLHIQFVGTTNIKSLNSPNIHLTNVLHEPTITKNLLSVSKLLTDNNAIVEFQKYFCFVKDKSTGSYCLRGLLEMDFIKLKDSP